MADAVTTKVLLNTPTHHVVHLTNVSDGTGEAAVAKVDKSTLTDSSNPPVEPDSLEIEQVSYVTNGFTNIQILWDHDTDELACVLPGTGTGVIDFLGREQRYGSVIGTRGLFDGRGAGGTGDILLTTVGHSAGDTYDITLWLRKAHV